MHGGYVVHIPVHWSTAGADASRCTEMSLQGKMEQDCWLVNMDFNHMGFKICGGKK